MSGATTTRPARSVSRPPGASLVRQPPAIDGFGGGGFRVAGVWRPGSLLILADEPRDWRPASLAELTQADLEAVIAAPAGTVEFVLLGTGRAQSLYACKLQNHVLFPPPLTRRSTGPNMPPLSRIRSDLTNESRK